MIHLLSNGPSSVNHRQLYTTTGGIHCVCVCVLKHVHSLYLPLQEIDANRLLVPAGEHALTVALNHAALSHRPVPHDHHLDGHLHILLQHLAAMLRGEIERCSQFTRLFLASASPAFG